MERGTKSQRGGEGRREWNGVGGQRPLANDGDLYLDIYAVAGVPKFLVTPLLMGPVCLYFARVDLKSQSAPGRKIALKRERKLNDADDENDGYTGAAVHGGVKSMLRLPKPPVLFCLFGD